MANSDERLHTILATLEQCRSELVHGGNRETAQLVSVAILELRMRLHKVSDSELKALCDAVQAGDAATERPQELKSPHGQRRRPLLKLVT